MVIALVAVVLIAVLVSRSGTNRSRATSKRGSLEIKSTEQAREAWLSGDLRRMINALDSKAKLVDRHFLLMSVVKETYRLRADPGMAQKCLEVAQMHVDEFPRIKTALKREFDGDLPRVPTFQQYATLLMERGQFDRAIEVCESAIAFGLDDGTKSGYEGRIERIKKKAAQGGGQKVPTPDSESTSSSKIITSNATAPQAADSFSELHRKRTRPITSEVLRLDDIPFVPLPRAPQRWEERGVPDARKEDAGDEELFQVLGEPNWDLSNPVKLSLDDRPDPAYRLHFSARSGTFLIDDRGRAAAHPGAPASVLSFGTSGDLLAERQISWDLYRLQVNPVGHGLIGVSSKQVLHCYDEHLNSLVAFPLTDTPELRASKSRFGIGDHEIHRHIRTAALRPDGGAFLFSVVDEAFALDMHARPLWGVRMPQKEGWERVGATTSLTGTSADVERAMDTLGLSYPFAAEDVKRRYRNLAKRWHPDMNLGREEQVAPEFRKVAAAAELLSGLDISEFAEPEERAIYQKTVGEAETISIGDTGFTISMGMSFGGEERSVADWIYAAGFSASGGAFLAGHSGKIVEIDGAGQPLRLFDTGSVPRRIADTGDYLYFLTDTRLYLIRDTTLSRVVDVFGKGELVVGQTGFGLLGRKAFRWYTEDGQFVGGVRTKHPLRRIFPTARGWSVETRQHRAELRGVPAWLEDC